MRLADDGTLLLSPSDLSAHLACPHLTSLNVRVQRRELDPLSAVDEILEKVFRIDTADGS